MQLSEMATQIIVLTMAAAIRRAARCGAARMALPSLLALHKRTSATLNHPACISGSSPTSFQASAIHRSLRYLPCSL